MAMAVRMTVNDMMDRYCPGLNELYDGEKRYRFYQSTYYEDFLEFYEQSESITYDRMDNILFNDYYGRNHSRKIKRLNAMLLFGNDIKTKHSQGELIDMLFNLQEDRMFNPYHHYYIHEIDDEDRPSGSMNERDRKWLKIAGCDEKTKNMIIAGKIYDLLDIMTLSEFYNTDPSNPSNNERNPFTDRIRDVYATIDRFYLNQPAYHTKWKEIMDPIKNLINCYSFPGEYNEIWVRANEAILYFDAAFVVLEECPEMFWKINEGQCDVHFAFPVDQGMIARRRQYFREKEKEDSIGNVHRSEEMLLEEELKKALMIIVNTEFEESEAL